MRTCPKCAYVRKATDDKVPDWQCPSCSIAYAKYAEQPAQPAATRRTVTYSANASASMPAKSLFFILAGIVALGWFGYDRFIKAPGDGAAAESGQILETSNPNFYGTMENGQPVLRMKPETLAGLQQVAPGKVVMFATNWCPYCAKARDVFAKQGVRYTEVNVEMDSRGADYQKETFGSTGVPLIVVGNRVMMGWDEGELLQGLKEI
jgi:glutaredoxin